MSEGQPRDDAAPPLRISTTRDDGRPVTIVVAGDLDYCTAGQLRRALADELEQTPARLCVHLGELQFIDSVGLAVLVAGWKRAHRDGIGYALVEVPPFLHRRLDTTGLLELLKVSSVEESAA
jgi:anti-sigma B factor antagonist